MLKKKGRPARKVKRGVEVRRGTIGAERMETTESTAIKDTERSGIGETREGRVGTSTREELHDLLLLLLLSCTVVIFLCGLEAEAESTQDISRVCTKVNIKEIKIRFRITCTLFIPENECQ